MAPDIIERLKASAQHQLYLALFPFTHARSSPSNADSLKLQLLTARKKEWWPATADSLPQAVTCHLWYTLMVQRWGLDKPFLWSPVKCRERSKELKTYTYEKQWS